MRANRRGGKTEYHRRDVARSGRSCRFCGEPGGEARSRRCLGATSYAKRSRSGTQPLAAVQRQAVDYKAVTMIAGSFPSNLAAPPSPDSTRDPLERLCGAVEKLLERLAPAKATA